jgi:hypothetical protein
MNIQVARWCVLAVSLVGSSIPAIAGDGMPYPSISGFSPTSGAPGTVITVTGSGFAGLNSAWIVGSGHNSAMSVVSDTEAKVTVPADAATGKLALLNSQNGAWSVNSFQVKTSTTPPPPVASWAYQDGVFSWPGDWSGDVITLNYHDTVGDPGTQDISVHVNSPWGFWLPYCPQVGPTINGYTVPSCDVSPYAGITMQLKATIAGQRWSLAIFKYNIVNGVLTDDTVVGGVDDLTPYGGPAVVGQFVTYTVPLSTLGASGLTTMYKFLLQDQTGRAGQTWYVNNVGFVK